MSLSHDLCSTIIAIAVSTPTLTVRDGHEITGFCFTPQDGDSLLSSIAATAWLMYPETCEQRIHQFVNSYLFDEV